MKARYIATASARKGKKNTLNLWQIAAVTTVIAGSAVVLGMSQVNSENRTAARGGEFTLTLLGSRDLPEQLTNKGDANTTKGIQVVDKSSRTTGTAPTGQKPSEPVVTSVAQIPALPGYTHAMPLDVANGAVVVGKMLNGSNVAYAFQWTYSGGTQLLGVLPGTPTSEARAVNSMGKAVGDSRLPNHSAGDAALFSSGVVTALAPNMPQSHAYAINESDIAVGYWVQNATTRARIWSSPTSYVDLGVFSGGQNSVAFGINNAGNVVGRSRLANGDDHAFYWTAGSPINSLSDLGVLPTGQNSEAVDINSNEQIVGTSTVAGPNTRAFKWTKGTGMVNLGYLDLPSTIGEGSTADSINNSGWVAGWSGTFDGECYVDPTPECDNAVIWSPGGTLYDLNALHPQTGWHYSRALGISDDGFVVGQGYYNGVLTGFLMKLTF